MNVIIGAKFQSETRRDVSSFLSATRNGKNPAKLVTPTVIPSTMRKKFPKSIGKNIGNIGNKKKLEIPERKSKLSGLFR